jgi:hypothetical protein
METKGQSRPVSLYFLTACLVFLIAGGWAGGLNFIFDPSGASLAMDPDAIKNLPVPDYFLPGIFLLVMYGLAPIPVLIALWTRPKFARLKALSRRFNEHWSWLLVLSLCLVLLVWLGLEVVLLGYIAPIQGTLIVFSLIFLGVILLPSIRHYYREEL